MLDFLGEDGPENLWLEIKAALQERDAHLPQYKDMLRQYHGRAYEKDEEGSGALENHYYEYASLMAPRLVADNPRVRVTSRNWEAQPGEITEADSLRHTLNRWVRDERLSEQLLEFAVNGFFGWGVAVVSQEPLPGKWDAKELGLKPGQEPMKPVVEILDTGDFFWDAEAKSRRGIRWQGHEYVTDKDDLIQTAKDDPDGGWDLETIQGLNPEDTRDDEGRKVGLKRKQVRVYEVWVPELQPDESLGPEDGFNGAILTLAASTRKGDSATTDAVYLREPRPYYGCHLGPYVTWGVHHVPGSTFWLSPLAAVNEQVGRLDAQARAYSNNAQQAKSGIAVNAAEPKVEEALDGFRQNGIFSVELAGSERMSDMFEKIEIGGPTKDALEYQAIERDRVERVTGISDAFRGQVGSGNTSATEIATATTGQSIRVDGVKDQFQAGVVGILTRAAWFFCEDERSRYQIGPEIAQSLGLPPGDTWYFPPEDEIPFEAYEFEIEMYSMERVDEGMLQKRALEFATYLLQLGQFEAQFPGVMPTNDIGKKLAEALNIPDMGELINTEAARAAYAQQQQAQVAPGGTGASSPQTPGQMIGGMVAPAMA